jgi:hypothetical protein
MERERYIPEYLHFFLLVIASHAPRHHRRAGPPLVFVAALALGPLTAVPPGIYACVSDGRNREPQQHASPQL